MLQVLLNVVAIFVQLYNDVDSFTMSSIQTYSHFTAPVTAEYQTKKFFLWFNLEFISTLITIIYHKGPYLSS